ncbi:MAG: hypothetical protein D6814_15965 [Calditrichaeota bacterium]|nr:MAG: hypothetical protein D6814_15965 [Calditrichota bacterium]
MYFNSGISFVIGLGNFKYCKPIFQRKRLKMDVIIIATKTCNHRPKLERQLQALGINYLIQFVDDRPDLIQKYDLHHSPNLLVDGKIMFQAMPGKSLPSPAELKKILNLQ